MRTTLQAIKVRLLFHLSLLVDDVAVAIQKAVIAVTDVVADWVDTKACVAQQRFELDQSEDVVAAIQSAPRSRAA